MAQPGTPVATDLGPRLQTAAAAVRDGIEAVELRRQQRDELIVRAVDEGMSQATVGRLSGISRNRVIAILYASQPSARVKGRPVPADELPYPEAET